MNIRLEYSPMTGQFNLAKISEVPDIANGFETVGSFVNAERARRFTEFVITKYPSLAIEQAETYPGMELLKKDLLLFLGEEIRLLNEHMSASFTRRKAVYTNR